MSKHIVFFSYSSKDEVTLKKLKEVLSQKLGGVVDIFMSSDGQSIPFGKNWVHKVEEALNNSTVMFVFVSPNSINSKWIYFEAGFSYSKGMRVVPVGIFGIDLERTSPPLNLLQGFNIKSAEALNNLIAIINDEYSYSFKESFTQENYEKIFVEDISLSNEGLKEYASIINTIKFELACDDYALAIDSIKKYFDDKKIEYQSLEHITYTYGISFQKDPYKNNMLIVEVDPIIIPVAFRIVDDIIKLFQTGDRVNYLFVIKFIDSVFYCKEPHRMTSRIYNTNIKIGENDFFVYGDINFKIEHYYNVGSAGATRGPSYIYIRFQGKSLADIKLYELLDILFSKEILYIVEQAEY